MSNSYMNSLSNISPIRFHSSSSFSLPSISQSEGSDAHRRKRLLIVSPSLLTSESEVAPSPLSRSELDESVTSFVPSLFSLRLFETCSSRFRPRCLIAGSSRATPPSEWLGFWASVAFSSPLSPWKRTRVVSLHDEIVLRWLSWVITRPLCYYLVQGRIYKLAH